jgi:hypothetical protein
MMSTSPFQGEVRGKRRRYDEERFGGPEIARRERRKKHRRKIG